MTYRVYGIYRDVPNSRRYEEVTTLAIPEDQEFDAEKTAKLFGGDHCWETSTMAIDLLTIAKTFVRKGVL